MKDILIIGGGPAGLTAGLYAVRAGLNTLLVEKQFCGGQAATTNLIENYPGFVQGVGGPELSAAMMEQAQAQGLEILYEDVQALELTGEVKRARMGERTEEARAVILCMGATPRPLGAPGEERLKGRGVSYCATCDGALYRGKDTAVVGGGNTAAEDALYLARFARRVTLIHRRDQFRASQVLVERIRATPNIDIAFTTVVKSIDGQERVQGLTLTHPDGGKERTLQVDGVFIAVGAVPETGLALGQVELDEAGYIRAGEDTRTNLSRVYAAGDIRVKPIRQVICAASDGAVAATAAQGDLLL